MKHPPITTANALAVTAAFVYVVCRALVGLLPDFMFSMGQSWFHGIQLQKLGTWTLTTENFIWGLLSLTVTAWLSGYVYASVYNLFLGKRRK